VPAEAKDVCQNRPTTHPRRTVTGKWQSKVAVRSRRGEIARKAIVGPEQAGGPRSWALDCEGRHKRERGGPRRANNGVGGNKGEGEPGEGGEHMAEGEAARGGWK